MQHLYGITGQEEALALKSIEKVEKFDEVSDFELSEKEDNDRFETVGYEHNSDWLAQ